VLFHLGELECWAGHWAAAARVAEESHDLASRAGQAVADRRAMTLDATIASYEGNADTARSIATTCLALAEHAGDSPAAVRCLKSLGVLELSLGNADNAVEHLERGIKIEASAGYDPATLRIVPDAIEALLAVERLDDAAPLVDALASRAMRSKRPWPQATAARCHGLLDAAAGRLTEAETALTTAVEHHHRLPQPFERARTLLALGTVQRRTKQKRTARASLHEALRLFETLGATQWAVRTRAELARIAGRAGSPLALTATEEQVARLVADGATNREVAASLFMSVKTVETNLTHIYRKLGVTSRRELTAHLLPRHSTGVSPA
jgi:DNA-binding CsgD family transcriptional regulator